MENQPKQMNGTFWLLYSTKGDWIRITFSKTNFSSHYLRSTWFYRFYCGGAILNPLQIITAAHCTFGKIRSRIVAVPHISQKKYLTGDPKTWPEKGYQVKNVVNHDSFEYFTMINDIAIITLSEPLNMSASKSSTIDLEAFDDLPNSKFCLQFQTNKNSASLTRALSFVYNFEPIRIQHR